MKKLVRLTISSEAGSEVFLAWQFRRGGGRAEPLAPDYRMYGAVFFAIAVNSSFVSGMALRNLAHASRGRELPNVGPSDP